MNRLMKEIQEARPKLRAVSPLAHWTVTVMGWFNVALGLALLLVLGDVRFQAPLLIVNDLFNFQFWGVLFLTLGIVKLYSLKSNNWGLARKTLLIGVSVKAAWMIALTIRILINPSTIFINLLWITVALLQMGAYVYFMPPSVPTNKQEEVKDA